MVYFISNYIFEYNNNKIDLVAIYMHELDHAFNNMVFIESLFYKPAKNLSEHD
jgi:hypothetical protein